ncbi:MAG: sensor histidine kinase [Promethearchaeota archaeon]
MFQIVFLLLHVLLYGIIPLFIAWFAKQDKVFFFYAYFGFLYVFTQLFAVLYSLRVTADLFITGGNIAYSSLIFMTIIVLFTTRDHMVIKNIIIIQIILNVFLFLLYALLSLVLSDSETLNIFNVPNALFSTTTPINIISSVVFTGETLLLFFCLEQVKMRLKEKYILFAAIYTAIFMGILVLDGFLFPFLVMFFDPLFGSFIVGGIIGKFLLGLCYSPFIVVYFIIFKFEFIAYIGLRIPVKSMFLPSRKNPMENLEKTKSLLASSQEDFKKAYNQAKFYKDIFTHDMSNIFQVMLGLFSLYNHRADREKDKIMEKIGIQLRRGKDLIEKIRRLSTIDQNSVHLKVMGVISTLKKATLLSKENTMRENEITISSNVQEFFVKSNELLIDIFKNIINNATIYNTSPVPRIDIVISREIDPAGKPFVKIEFIDNGVGIPEEAKDAIFREGHLDVKSGKGMGLGLSLVVKGLFQYGGTIKIIDRVEGDHKQGSNFIVRIPEIPETGK